MTGSPFDHRHDTELGSALREALACSDDSGFVARVMARVRDKEAPAVLGSSGWDVLSIWARPGLAAAAILAIISGLWLWTAGASADREVTLHDVLEQAAEETAPRNLISAPSPPDADVVLATVFEP